MKTALITGAGSGIGLATAKILAAEGFELALIGRRQAMLEAAANEVRKAGVPAWVGALDVRDAPVVEAFVNDQGRHWGKIDLLVHAAGIFTMQPFEKTSLELWHETIGINLTGAFVTAKAAWPYLDGGQIIFVSSVAGVEPYPGCAAYSASKYGLNGLSEVLALEGKKRHIRVHTLCPGNTETPLWGDQAPPEVKQRMMRPEQVAEAIRWLALSPPGVSFDTVVMRPAVNPWAETNGK